MNSPSYGETTMIMLRRASTNLRWLLFSLLLLIAGAVHAEGGCPPGMIPASGTDINSCVPIPPGYYNNQQQAQPPPPRWVDHWGAIAADGPSGSLGVSVNMTSQSGAENAALADCHSKKGAICTIETWYINGCAAMVMGDKSHTSNNAGSLNEAIQIGMNTCNTADTNCHVYYSACSLPVRIQ